MLALNWNLLWTFVNLIVLTLLLKKFLYSPVLKIMNERKKLIESQMNEAEEKNKEADEKLTKATDMIKNAKDEAQREAALIIENAKDKNDAIISAAEKEASRIIDESKIRSEKDRNIILSSARGEIINLSLEAAKKVAKANISEEQQKKFFDDMLNKVGDVNVE